MNPIKFIMQRPMTTMLTVAAVLGAGVFGLKKMRADTYPPQQTPKVYVYLDYVEDKAHHAKEFIVGQYEKHFKKHEEEVHHEEHKILVTSPVAQDVTIHQEYVCQIHSQRHIDIQALSGGYLEAIPIKEGQTVKKGDLMFKVVPILYQAKLDAEAAKRDLAQYKYNYTKRLGDQKVVSSNEVALLGAELAEAQAKVKEAEAELNFATIKAPFDGIVNKLNQQQGSLVEKGDILTTLSDNSIMWVYFNVPERRYLEYMAEMGSGIESPDIELRLANLNKFKYTGKIGAIEAQFNNETGNIPFRADFPNPEGLLRHGQTGTVVISRALKDAIVIPQRATYETLAKRYVYVVDEKEIVHQREIVIQYELEDLFVIEKGLGVNDKIVFEGIRQIHDGEKVEFTFHTQAELSTDLKHHAE